jgi:hypothetical protein
MTGKATNIIPKEDYIPMIYMIYHKQNNRNIDINEIVFDLSIVFFPLAKPRMIFKYDDILIVLNP